MEVTSHRLNFQRATSMRQKLPTSFDRACMLWPICTVWTLCIVILSRKIYWSLSTSASWSWLILVKANSARKNQGRTSAWKDHRCLWHQRSLRVATTSAAIYGPSASSPTFAYQASCPSRLQRLRSCSFASFRAISTLNLMHGNRYRDRPCTS